MKIPVDQQFLKDSDRPNNHSRSLQSSLPTLMLGWNSKSSPRLHAEMPSAVAVWLADELCVLPSELTSVPNKVAGMCIAHSDNLLFWNEASECRGLSIDAAVLLSMVLKAAAKSQAQNVLLPEVTMYPKKHPTPPKKLLKYWPKPHMIIQSKLDNCSYC